MKKKVCIVTAARSEYGILRWVIDEVHHDEQLELQLVVTGAHLLEEQGYTYKAIEEDGYPITAFADMHLKADTQVNIVKSMGNCSIVFADTFQKLTPDIVVVLGDRYELVPICSAALVMNIPIAHISGGDVTEGAIDNEVRNMVTMISTLHFPGVRTSADNIIRMRGSDKNVFTVGEPGLDNFRKFHLMDRRELSDNIGLPLNNKWVLITLHAETQSSLEYNLRMASNLIESLMPLEDVSIVITKSNADFGGVQINEYFQNVADRYSDKVKLFASLGQLRYLSFMKECYAVMGNSSSGIVEAPCLGKPVINIGHRQEGRHLCPNVIQVENDATQIENAINSLKERDTFEPDFYYGDGATSVKIVSRIKNYLNV